MKDQSPHGARRTSMHEDGPALGIGAQKREEGHPPMGAALARESDSE